MPFRIATLLALFAAALNVFAQSGPLSMDDAAKLALVNQPLTTGQRAAIDAARESAVAQGALPDPRLKLGVGNLPVDTWSLTRDGMTQQTVSIEQMVPRAEKRDLRRRHMELEAEQAEEELASLERSIRRDTRLAWLNLYLPLKSIELVDAGIALIRDQEEAARIGLTSGKAQMLDVTRAQIESGRERDRRADLGAQAARARAELARWIGRAAERDLANPAEWKSPSPASVLHQHLDDHPQMRGARREIEVADNELAQAEARKRPDWSVELAYSRRGPQFPDMVGVQFAIELPVFPENRQNREVAAKAAQKTRVENMHADHERRLAAELAAFHADWEGVNRRIAEFDRDLLPRANSRIDATLAAYAAGRADVAAVLDARRMHLDLRLQRLALEVALQKARVQLAYFEESGETK